MLRDTVASGKAMLIQQVLQDERYADARSLVDSRSGSVICVPVMVDGQARAVLYADRDLMRMPFQPGDLDFAMAAVDLAAGAVSVDELQAKTRELSRLKGRIDVGREMQKMLMPSPIPQPAWGEVAALNHPADQMSGDIYDVRFDAKGRLLVSIADVSGKGVPAAFVTAILQSSFRQSVREHEALAAIINGVNAALNSSIPPDCFATMIVFVFRWKAIAWKLRTPATMHPYGSCETETSRSFPTKWAFPWESCPNGKNVLYRAGWTTTVSWYCPAMA
ncbi:MAG: SpoIIE family protein phosphatase [Planctomycetes bacterium]|nr:SpoIIE family protein phosphatase [Planctomycetota bacterium]